MAALRELLPDVLTWAWWSERFGYDFNGYLVRHPAGAVVVDPVEMTDEELDAIAAERPARVALTNRNHFRDAGRVRARTGARVAVHPADADFVRGKGVTVDDDLVPGQRVGPLVVLDAHGKSPGEVALHWPERRLLLVGDACVGRAPGVLGLLPPAVIDDAEALRATLRRLAADVDFDALLVADGHPILSGARAALARLVATFDAA